MLDDMNDGAAALPFHADSSNVFDVISSSKTDRADKAKRTCHDEAIRKSVPIEMRFLDRARGWYDKNEALLQRSLKRVEARKSDQIRALFKAFDIQTPDCLEKAMRGDDATFNESLHYVSKYNLSLVYEGLEEIDRQNKAVMARVRGNFCGYQLGYFERLFDLVRRDRRLDAGSFPDYLNAYCERTGDAAPDFCYDLYRAARQDGIYPDDEAISRETSRQRGRLFQAFKTQVKQVVSGFSQLGRWGFRGALCGAFLFGASSAAAYDVDRGQALQRGDQGQNIADFVMDEYSHVCADYSYNPAFS